MRMRDIKPWEWIVAIVLLLVAASRAVLAVEGHAAMDMPVPTTRACLQAASILLTAVLLWTIWCIYRMAKWQDRKSGIFLVLFAVVLLNGVYSPLQEYLVSDVKLQFVIVGIFGLFRFIIGIIATVRLFHDRVKPLDTIMVLYVVLPVLLNISIPLLIRADKTLAFALVGGITSMLVVLLFLFRNAPGEMDEED